MKHIMKFWSITFIILFLSVIMPAQKNNWDIVKSSGDTLSYCLFQELNDSLLTFECNGIVRSIPADSIDCLFLHKESHFGSGTVIIGSITGIVLGTAIGAVSSHHSNSWDLDYDVSAIIGGGILVGLAGFTVGGIIGGSVGGDDVYDISSRSHTQKVMIIRTLMSK